MRLKLGLKIYQEYAKIENFGYIEKFWNENFILLFYFIYLVNFE